LNRVPHHVPLLTKFGSSAVSLINTPNKPVEPNCFRKGLTVRVNWIVDS